MARTIDRVIDYVLDSEIGLSDVEKQLIVDRLSQRPTAAEFERARLRVRSADGSPVDARYRSWGD